LNVEIRTSLTKIEYKKVLEFFDKLGLDFTIYDSMGNTIKEVFN